MDCNLIALCGVVWFVLGGTVLQAQAGQIDTLPDYRWIVAEQKIVVQAEDLGLRQPHRISPEGLTRAKNGDLLLAVCCMEASKTFIMRSTDQGHTWMVQGVLENREGGTTEGMVSLRNGRLVIVCYKCDGAATTIRSGTEYYVPGGGNFRFAYLRSQQWGAYSDDEGKTWHYTSPMNISPFQAASFTASGQIFETEEGTLVTSFYGHLNEEQVVSGVGSVGIIRSHDSGQTWGDVSVVCSGHPGSGDWYNESDVISLPDGRWLCMVRMNPNNEHGKFLLYLKRCYSHDRGRTWSYPVPTQFRGGEPGAAVLPDGAVLCVQTGGRFFECVYREDRVEVLRYGSDDPKLLYEVSYNGGLTWAYWGDLYRPQVGSKETMGATIVRVLDDDNLIVVYRRGTQSLAQAHGRQAWIIGASWLKRVAADSPKASVLRVQ